MSNTVKLLRRLKICADCHKWVNHRCQLGYAARATSQPCQQGVHKADAAEYAKRWSW